MSGLTAADPTRESEAKQATAPELSSRPAVPTAAVTAAVLYQADDRGVGRLDRVRRVIEEALVDAHTQGFLIGRDRVREEFKRVFGL